jgi:hypothetical protein
MLEIMLQAIAVRRSNVADVTPKQYMFAAKDERDEFLNVDRLANLGYR